MIMASTNVLILYLLDYVYNERAIHVSFNYVFAQLCAV